MKIQYFGKRGLRPPGLEFRILCLEGSVISSISPFSRGSPGPAQPMCAQRGPKTPFISFYSVDSEPTPYHSCTACITNISYGTYIAICIEHIMLYLLTRKHLRNIVNTFRLYFLFYLLWYCLIYLKYLVCDDIWWSRLLVVGEKTW